MKRDDPELLLGLSQDELDALANSKLAPDAQSQLDNLLAKQKEMSENWHSMEKVYG